MNLANLGLSGLNAAQSRLQASGHNINNAATQGYSRQSVLVSSAGGATGSAGNVGRGVQVVTVQRAYDEFLARKLDSAQTTSASIAAYGAEISQINNLLADHTVGIAPALQKFFASVQAVASAPADSAARQELLGRASGLVGQINDTNEFLDSQRDNINTQISTIVTQVNNYAERVRDLNTQIITARATAIGHEPNDLLDQRDRLVSELGQLIGVKVVDQDGQFSLAVGNGQLLLGGNKVFPLNTRPSPSDPARVAVAYSVQGPDGAMLLADLPEDRIKGGTLGGLLQYRNETLGQLQNQLGRMAVGLSQAFNEIHRTGMDLTGAEGKDFFVLGGVAGMPHAVNAGSGSVTASYFDVGALSGQDYRVEHREGGYVVTSIPAGVVTQLSADQTNIDGISFAFGDGEAAVGDSWLVQPTRSAGATLALAITDPASIAAAASNTGTANGDTALALAQLQTAKIFDNGTVSLNEAFSQIVNRVGVLTQQNSTQAKAQAALIQQSFATQQSVSGVNLNEEYINIQRHMEQFQAAARLISVSNALFDTLLSLRS
ncbi:flagellar hook-associated protein FlgK [Allopusillimonas ginsengisoli]|uniref:flagellar hook-associated protein FlgK n=1 Tax=Allopusillimonas ginsengisoli TaxID=453575 RepID=UPI0010200E72|nr:flagellar hook-associated protein FlgK [Allopusillimonas ginsengisoli]TEA79407.1 flagellar hook-associated protein FlgK [Allopusillimonas ginsengisoli]